MFERHNFQPNNEALGWNGRLNGRPLDPAVFVYWAELEFLDGHTEVFTGDLNLVK
jgi:hypothetical protein